MLQFNLTFLKKKPGYVKLKTKAENKKKIVVCQAPEKGYNHDMCLILIATHFHPDYPLILAANRDEFYDRPTDRLDFWPDHPGLLAGRDRLAGGTWLGITRQGRIGAITNYREPFSMDPTAPSRGKLVEDFLTGDLDPEDFIRQNDSLMARCNGFNLVIGNWDRLCYYSNREGRLRILPPGVHGLCNHLLNTSWPKVRYGKDALTSLVAGGGVISHQDILDLLADRTMPPDDQLPDTGVGLDWERRLSSVFIKSDIYGTRSSTVITVDSGKIARVTEQGHGPGEDGTLKTAAFQIQ